jgi:hypothetical protein
VRRGWVFRYISGVVWERQLGADGLGNAGQARSGVDQIHAIEPPSGQLTFSHQLGRLLILSNGDADHARGVVAHEKKHRNSVISLTREGRGEPFVGSHRLFACHVFRPKLLELPVRRLKLRPRRPRGKPAVEIGVLTRLN